MKDRYIYCDRNGIPDETDFEAVYRNVYRGSLLSKLIKTDRISINLMEKETMLDLKGKKGELSSLDFLKYFPNLEFLYLKDMSRPLDLSPVSGLRNLHHIMITNVRVISLAPLSTCKRMEDLSLDRVTVDDEDFSVLGGLIGVRTLDISSCGLTDISWISGMKRLEAATFTDNPIDDISVAFTLPCLKWIDTDREALGKKELGSQKK